MIEMGKEEKDRLRLRKEYIARQQAEARQLTEERKARERKQAEKRNQAKELKQAEARQKKNAQLPHREGNIAPQQAEAHQKVNSNRDVSIQKNPPVENRVELTMGKEEKDRLRLRQEYIARQQAEAHQKVNFNRGGETQEKITLREREENLALEKKAKYVGIFIAFSAIVFIVYIVYVIATSPLPPISELMMHFFFWTSLALLGIIVVYSMFVWPIRALFETTGDLDDQVIFGFLIALGISIACLVLSVGAFIGGFIGFCLIWMVILALAFIKETTS